MRARFFLLLACLLFFTIMEILIEWKWNNYREKSFPYSSADDSFKGRLWFAMVVSGQMKVCFTESIQGTSAQRKCVDAGSFHCSKFIHSFLTQRNNFAKQMW
jgi:hypothetical protein